MVELSFLSAFLIGIAGSAHCTVMCGGVITGLSYAIPKNKSLLPYALSYNVGRICSYVVAGGFAGYLGQIASHEAQLGVVWLQLFGGLMLLLMAGYIGGWFFVLTKLEKLGQGIWHVIRPISKSFVPFKTPLHALPYGLIWGWLPCGLVYSTLSWSLSAGSLTSGAMVMLAFGLGTLPSTLSLSIFSREVLNFLSNPKAKQILAFLLMLFALYSISQSLRGLFA